MNLIKRITDQIRRMLLLVKPVVIGRFRYKYEYVSPFGEYWLIYRLWFGFIPIKYSEYKYEIGVDSRENYTEVMNYVASLNALMQQKNCNNRHTDLD